MLAIVLIIVSIALVGALIYGGTTTLQSNSPVRSQAKENTVTAIYALATAYQSYVSANGSDLTAGTCGSTELVPTYLSAVKFPVPNMSCNFGADANNQCTGASCGDYFCYHGTNVSQAAYNGFGDAKASFPAGSYVIGTTKCGEHGTTDAAPASWPATVYITYWLQGS